LAVLTDIQEQEEELILKHNEKAQLLVQAKELKLQQMQEETERQIAEAEEITSEAISNIVHQAQLEKKSIEEQTELRKQKAQKEIETITSNYQTTQDELIGNQIFETQRLRESYEAKVLEEKCKQEKLKPYSLSNLVSKALSCSSRAFTRSSDEQPITDAYEYSSGETNTTNFAGESPPIDDQSPPNSKKPCVIAILIGATGLTLFVIGFSICFFK